MWIADGLSDVEAEGLRDLRPFLQDGPETAGRFVDMPWFVDGLNYDESQLAYSLNRVRAADGKLALSIATHPWIADEPAPTSDHWSPLVDLAFVAHENKPLARRLSASLTGGFGWEQSRLISTLRGIIQEKREIWEQIRLQAWYGDGLNAEEEAFLLVAPDILNNAPEQFYEMITVRYVESRTVYLPLSGIVDVRLIKKTPFNEAEALHSEIERALILLERLTGMPLPVQEVIVLIVVVDSQSDFERSKSSLSVDWPRGAHAGAFIRVAKFGNEPVYRGTLFHELAHYYFQDFPVWFLEGGAEFAASYIATNSGYGSASQWEASVDRNIGSGCPSGDKSLSELGNPGFTYVGRANVSCFYGMGSLFLSKLYFGLGEDVMAASLKDIFTYTRSANRSGLTAKDIFRFFLQNLKPGQEQEFRNLFRLLHGGPVVEPVPEGPDDHSDDASRATPLSTGVTAHGSLDHVWDVDYFRVQVVADDTYRVVVQTDIRRSHLSSDLNVQVVTPGGEPVKRLLRAGWAAKDGIEVIWRAPESRAYLLKLDSPGGNRGQYSILVGQPASDDDHGDNTQTATPIDFDISVSGTLERSSDVDYFKLKAIQNWGYEAIVRNTTLTFSKVDVYDPDGQQVGSSDAGWGRRGSHMSFLTEAQGEYYLAVYSPDGHTGDYELTLEAADTQHGPA